MEPQPVADVGSVNAPTVRRVLVLFAILLLLLGAVLVTLSVSLLVFSRSANVPEALPTRIAAVTLGALALPSFFQSAVLLWSRFRSTAQAGALPSLITAVAAPVIGLVGAALAAFSAASGFGVLLGAFPLVVACVILGLALLSRRFIAVLAAPST